MVSDMIGVVDDAQGRMVSVQTDGDQVIIQFGGDDRRVFDPSQVAELIDHLTNARLDALLAASRATANCGECSHLWTRHDDAGCGSKIYPSWSLTGEPCPCVQRGDGDE